MNLESKISNFFNDLVKEHEKHVILNEVFAMLSQSVHYGLDEMIRALHYQCIKNDNIDEVNLESGWESADGKNHMAVICVKNDDNQEHCFGEWLEQNQGVIVLEPNRDNDDAENIAKGFLESRGYVVNRNDDSNSVQIYKATQYLQKEGFIVIDANAKDKGFQHAKDIVQTMGAIVYNSAECELEDFIDSGYLVVKDGVNGTSNINDVIKYLNDKGYITFDVGADGTPPIVEYLETRGYTCVDSDLINSFCVEHLTEENYFVCDKGSEIEELINLYLGNPKKFSNILTKEYQYKIDSCVDFGLSGVIRATSQAEAHELVAHQLDVKIADLNKMLEGFATIEKSRIGINWL